MIDIRRDSPQPVYEQIKNALRTQITSGALKPDALIPDERSLAVQLGLGRMTVRRAIVELTAEGLLKRVRGKGTFVRAAFVAQPRRTRTTIGIVTEIDRLGRIGSGPFYDAILHGIYDATEQAGLCVAYRRISEPHAAFVAGLRKDSSLKGLLLLGIAQGALIEALTHCHLPLVLVDSVQPSEKPVVDEVNHTCQGAVVSAIHSLLRLGHRDIGLMIPENPSYFFRERQAGFEQALRNFNVPFDRRRLYPVMPCSMASCSMMRQILQSGDVPTALFCTSDEMAVGVMSAVNDYGLRVPRDLSVIGYGDLGIFTSPWLSTVRIPTVQLGTQAVAVLCERLKHPSAPIKRVLLASDFMQRGTCDYPRLSALLPAVPQRRDTVGGQTGAS